MKFLISRSFFEENDGMHFLSEEGKTIIVEAAISALDTFYEEQECLFINGLSEETLKYQYVYYFLDEICIAMKDEDESNNVSYVVDFNYNRIQRYGKRILPTSSDERGKLFDLVVHQRGYGNDLFPENLVHFEFKVRGSFVRKSFAADLNRLKSTTTNSKCAHIVRQGFKIIENISFVQGYQLGLFISFNLYPKHIGEPFDYMRVFANGQDISSDELTNEILPLMAEIETEEY